MMIRCLCIALSLALSALAQDTGSPKTVKVKKALKQAPKRSADPCRWAIDCGPGEECKYPDGSEEGVCVDDPAARLEPK